MSRRTYRVTWAEAPAHSLGLPSHHQADVEADSPERAGAEALLVAYGAIRPGGAPERVQVDGAVYQVDEWLEAEVHLVKQGAPVDPRVCAERALKHLRLARKALAHFHDVSGPEARLGRGLCAEVDELGARLEVLAQDLIVGKAGAP